MKKLAFIIMVSFFGMLAVKAFNPVVSATQSMDQVLYAKVINDTGAEFKYKVGADIYIIDINESEPFAYEENTQILKKNALGEWVNWFVFGSSLSNQSHQLSTLLNL